MPAGRHATLRGGVMSRFMSSDPTSAGIVLLCGRAFSGKSTLAAALAGALPAKIISFDAINAERGLYGGQGIPISEWGRTRDIAHDRVRDAIRRISSVVIDDSSPRFLRDEWRALARSVSAQLVLVFVDTPISEIRERQRANRKAPTRQDVSDPVMAAHLNSFDPPGADEQPVRYQPGVTDLRTTIDILNARLCSTK